MAEGNWRAGVYVDEVASDSQADQLAPVVYGDRGGPPGMFATLIGERLGVEKVPMAYSESGRQHHLSIGDAVDVGVEDFVAIAGGDPVQLANVSHPSNTTLTVAPADVARMSTFGIDRGREGQSGFSAPFSWADTVTLARGMGGVSGMPGTMGLSLLAFVPTWTLMMSAMMLPSVTPTASLYAKTVQDNRAARITGLVVGYLAVWAVAGLPAYGLGCCWGLMVILIAVGVMNVLAMVALALALALAAIWLPWLAPGLHIAPQMAPMPHM